MMVKDEIIRRALYKRGFKLQKFNILNMRNKVAHPLETFSNVKSTAATFLMEIPLDRSRTQLWHTLEADNNPFVKTLVDYKEGVQTAYEHSVIEKYYDDYKPKNAADVLRLKTNEVLKNLPAISYVFPWDVQSADELLKVRKRDARRENGSMKKDLGLSAGYTEFGPVSKEKGEIEFNRLIRISEDIKKSGYMEKPYLNDGGIRGYFLVGRAQNDWCFVIQSGKHRAYALAASGAQNIPVVVDNHWGTMKRLADAPFWPQVSRGLFSITEAETLVRNIISG